MKMLKAVIIICLGLIMWAFVYMMKHDMMNISWCAWATISFIAFITAIPKEKE